MSCVVANRAAALLLFLGSLGACADDNDGPEHSAHDGGLNSGIGSDADISDATVSHDGGGDKNALTACLDRPDAPLAPPTGKLGCELIPPGLSLPAQ